MKTLLFLSLLASIPTANVDLNRTNTNTAETQLTPTSVTAGGFRKLGSYTVDGFIFAQPLYVPAITTSGTVHDLVIVATLNNSVYAFDAAAPGTAAVWSNLNFATPYTGYPVVESALYSQGLGCLSTPVVDAPNNKLYVVCDSVFGGAPNWILRQLNLSTGATVLTTTLTGHVVGTGDTGTVGGDSPPGVADTTSGINLVFFPEYEFQRAGLALSADSSTLYIGFGGLDDTRPYHGWLMARNTSDLSPAAIWCASPNSWGGAVWMSGGAPAIDASGNVYLTTGNGFRAGDSTAITNAGVKLSANLGTVATWFPSDDATDDTDDLDQASNRFMLIPGTGFGVVAGKDLNIYLLQLSNMTLAQTAFQTCSGCSPSASSGSFGFAFMNNVLFAPVTAGGIYAFTFSGSTFNTTPVSQTNTYGFPGPAQMMGSINGSSNGILWVVTCASGTHTTVQQGILRAINPATLAEYWNSSTSGHDTLGNLTKFASPTVAAGKVFVATQDSKVQVFGVVSSATIRGSATMRGSAVIR